jgi:hypothetical protein
MQIEPIARFDSQFMLIFPKLILAITSSYIEPPFLFKVEYGSLTFYLVLLTYDALRRMRLKT